MRIYLTAMMLFAVALCTAQNLTYSKVVYDFMPMDSTLKWWHRELVKPVNVAIDSVRKQIRIPTFEMQVAQCSMQDLIRGVYSTRKDTSLVALDWNTGLGVSSTRVLQPGVQFWALKDSITAFKVDDHLFIVYPEKNKYVRVIEFIK